MSDYVGDNLVYDFYVVSTASQPLVGEVPVLSDGSGPRDPHGFHWEELGGGWYRVTSNPAMDVGTYHVLVTFRTEGDPDHQQLAITWDVDALPGDQDIVIAMDGQHGTSLGELRRRLARSMRDYRLGVATREGSATTFVDEFNLQDNTDFFRGAEMIVRQGHPSDIGKKRKVVASSYEHSTITFNPPLDGPTQIGDQIDLFRFIRNGFGVQEYDDAINDAIAAGFPQNRVEIAVIPSEAISLSTGYIPVPSTVYGIYGLSVERENSSYEDWGPVPMAHLPNHAGFYVDTARRIITMPGYWESVNAKRFVIYGYGRPRVLVNDTDLTTVDPEWIIDQAAGMLLTSSMDQATFAMGQARANRADQLRAKMVTPPKPSTVWLA